MIRLENNESQDLDSLDLEKSFDALGIDDENTSHVDSTPSQQGDLNTLSQEILATLASKNIPPLPSNYQAFFEQLLNNYDIEFQKKIYSLMETESKSDDRNITFEKNIFLAFAKTKELLRCTSGIYKSFVALEDTQHRFLAGLQPNAENTQFAREIKKIQNTIDEQINQLKTLYQQCNKALENINTNTMYDSKFDVYNKRYFIKLVEEEVASVKRFQHISSILMIALPYSVIKYLDNEKIAIVVMKTVAKLLLKTSRRSDMIGYIGNGIFGMLLKHSNIPSSKKASERLIELLQNTNIFISNSEIKLDLNIGMAMITPTRTAQDSLNFAISSLRLAQQNKIPYIVYKEDEE